MPPHEYVSRIRIEKPERLIRKNISLSRVAQKTGFSSQAHFTKVFRKITGMTPGRYRKEQSEPTIKTTIRRI